MKVFRSILVLFLVAVSIQNASAQKVLKKVSKEACTCFEKIDLGQDPDVIDDAFAECLGKSIIGHRKELEKEYKMEFSEKMMDKMQGDMVNVLVSECDFMLKYAMLMAAREDNSDDDIVAIDSIAVDTAAVAAVSAEECKALHLGKFKYMKDGVPDDTKYLEFTKDNILDYDSKGNLVTTSSIKWKDDCSYVSTMTKTTSEEMKKFVKDKTTLEATIIAIDGDTISYAVKVYGVETIFQLKKIK